MKLEDYFKDMQDLEFTIQDGKLWLLRQNEIVKTKENRMNKYEISDVDGEIEVRAINA